MDFMEVLLAGWIIKEMVTLLFRFVQGLIQGNEASIFAGCGVVQDSIAELEFEETNIKFKPMLSALGGLKG